MNINVRRVGLAAPLLALSLFAAEPGDSTFVGWRGDGTGKYPAAQPPASWGRVSKAVKGLRAHAARPKESDAGAPMADGVVREWLVLTPAPRGARADKPILPNAAEPAPAGGEKAGG